MTEASHRAQTSATHSGLVATGAQTLAQFGWALHQMIAGWLVGWLREESHLLVVVFWQPRRATTAMMTVMTVLWENTREHTGIDK